LPASTSVQSTSTSSSTTQSNNFKKRKLSNTHLVTPPIVSRSERLEARNRVPIGDVSKLKMVKVMINDKMYKEIDLTKRRSSEDLFKESVLSNVCRKPYNKLLIRDKKKRINDIAIVILNKCIINRSEFRKNGFEYLEGNEDVALNIIDLIDGVKKALEKRMKVEFKRIADRAIPPIEDDVDGAIEFIDETKLEYELAVSLLVSLLSPKYLQLSHLIYLSAETRNNFLLYITESGGTTLLSSLTDMTFSST